MADESVKRESFWDVLKGLSILSVIVMHWANQDTVRRRDASTDSRINFKVDL